MKKKSENGPQGERAISHPFGCLKYGNPPCDLRSLPRCQARAKSTGSRCRNATVKGKRVCRLHGGRSTGPKTAEGLERSKKANWKHGRYSAEARALGEKVRALSRIAKTTLKEI